METINTAIRKMNILERVFYMVPGYKVTMTARIEGDIDVNRFREAIKKVQKIHPLLRSRVEKDHNGNAFFTTENALPVEVIIHKMQSDMHWYDVFMEEMPKLYDPEEKPMISFVLIRGTEYNDLLVMASHSITDGMAVVFIIRDLLMAYSEPDKPITELYPVEAMDFLPSKVVHSLKNRIAGIYAGSLSRKWNKNPIFFERKDYVSVNQWFWRRNNYQALFFELSDYALIKLIQVCKNENVSIGNAIAIAFIFAHQKIVGSFESYQQNVSIPFDLRRHAKNKIGDIVSMCSGDVDLKFVVDANKTIWENARKFQQKLVKKTSRLNTGFLDLLKFDPNLIDAMTTFSVPALTDPKGVGITENINKLISDKDNVAFSLVKKYMDKASGTVSSNLGNLKIPQQYGNIYLRRMILIPLLKSSSPLFQTVTTIGNKLVFSMSFSVPDEVSLNDKMKEMTDIRSVALELLGFGKITSDRRYLSIK